VFSVYITDHTVSGLAEVSKVVVVNDAGRCSITVLCRTQNQFVTRTLVHETDAIRQQTLHLFVDSHYQPRLQHCIDCHLYFPYLPAHSTPSKAAEANPTTAQGTLKAHTVPQQATACYLHCKYSVMTRDFHMKPRKLNVYSAHNSTMTRTKTVTRGRANWE
jgi:hypothetical protein